MPRFGLFGVPLPPFGTRLCPLNSRPRLSCQQLVPSFGLRIGPVLDLEPSISIVFVNPQLSLRHYPFQIARANLFEKLFALALDVLGKQQPFAIARLYEASEAALTLDERELPKVFSVEPKEVEC